MKIHAPNARLVDRQDWTHGLATFHIELDAGPTPMFESGQFTNLALPAGETWDAETGAAINRAYSIASSPGARRYEFFVRLVEGGALTPKLFALPLGGTCWVDDRIAGHFTLEDAPDAEDLVLVGTGTGIAPYRPMILDPRTRKRFRRVILMYTDRTRPELGYVEEFEALAKRDPGFVFLPSLTREPEGSPWRGLRGRIQHFLTPAKYQELTGKPLTPERCQVFLCGNPQMIVEVQTQLEQHGFRKHRKKEPGQLHIEKYW